MGQINFENIPSGIRVPGNYYEVDSSQANTGLGINRRLIISQMLPSGTATPNFPFLATNILAVKQAVGVGSMAALHYVQARTSAPAAEIWLCPMLDNGAGVAAQGSLAFTGAVTTAGTLPLYVNGVSVQVAAPLGATAAAMATATAAAINALPDLIVTASNGTAGTATVTAKHKGVIAGQCPLVLAYYGANNGEAIPAGLSVTVNQLAGGTADPVLDTAMLNLVGRTYAYVLTPYTGAAALADIGSYLSDQTGTWSYVKAQFGGAFSAYQGTTAQLQTWGVTNNNQHLSVMGVPVGAPQAAHLWAIEYGSQAANSLDIDPALPITAQVMNVLAPPAANVPQFLDKQTLLYCGISVFSCNAANTVSIQRAVTTYQLNSEGVPDNSYLDVETPYCIAAFLELLNAAYSTNFARKKLVADLTVLANPSNNFVTAATINACLIATYFTACANGIMQNPEAFAKACYSNNAGGGVVQQYAPVNVMNQLRVIEVLAQFTKS